MLPKGKRQRDISEKFIGINEQLKMKDFLKKQGKTEKVTPGVSEEYRYALFAANVSVNFISF